MNKAPGEVVVLDVGLTRVMCRGIVLLRSGDELFWSQNRGTVRLVHSNTAPGNFGVAKSHACQLSTGGSVVDLSNVALANARGAEERTAQSAMVARMYNMIAARAERRVTERVASTQARQQWCRRVIWAGPQCLLELCMTYSIVNWRTFDTSTCC
jgi:hypothetical protein